MLQKTIVGLRILRVRRIDNPLNEAIQATEVGRTIGSRSMSERTCGYA